LQKAQFQKKQKIENVTLLKLKNVISEEVYCNKLISVAYLWKKHIVKQFEISLVCRGKSAWTALSRRPDAPRARPFLIYFTGASTIINACNIVYGIIISLRKGKAPKDIEPVAHVKTAGRI